MLLRRKFSSPERKNLYQEYLKTSHWKDAVPVHFVWLATAARDAQRADGLRCIT